MKDVLITWKKEIFDSTNRLLPSSLTLYSHIVLDEKLGSWSLIFSFEEPPKDQGYLSIGKVDFIIDNAPKFIFKEGFKFNFLDGKTIIGICEII